MWGEFTGMVPFLWADAGTRHATMGTGFDGIPLRDELELERRLD